MFVWAVDDIVVKIAKYFWDVVRYDIGCLGVIGVMWFHKRGSIMFTCLLFWSG